MIKNRRGKKRKKQFVEVHHPFLPGYILYSSRCCSLCSCCSGIQSAVNCEKANELWAMKKERKKLGKKKKERKKERKKESSFFLSFFLSPSSSLTIGAKQSAPNERGLDA